MCMCTQQSVSPGLDQGASGLYFPSRVFADKLLLYKEAFLHLLAGLSFVDLFCALSSSKEGTLAEKRLQGREGRSKKSRGQPEKGARFGAHGGGCHLDFFDPPGPPCLLTGEPREGAGKDVFPFSFQVKEHEGHGG